MIAGRNSRILATLLASLCLQTLPHHAQDVGSLQISTSSEKTASESMMLEDLDTLEQVAFTTSTIWTDGVKTFSGVPLKALLSAMDLEGEVVQLTALNDYAISIPVDELEHDLPIVATRIDGQPMPVREKGPYWLVYPYDRNAAYRTETIYARSIWQLNRLKVLD